MKNRKIKNYFVYTLSYSLFKLNTSVCRKRG